jgi:hypothetical protein
MQHAGRRARQLSFQTVEAAVEPADINIGHEP